MSSKVNDAASDGSSTLECSSPDRESVKDCFRDLVDDLRGELVLSKINSGSETSPSQQSIKEIYDLPFTLISRDRAAENLNKILEILEEVKLIHSNLAPALSQTRNGSLFIYYMESGEIVGDKFRVNRKTKEYYITSHAGPNSRYSEYRIRQYFSPLARRILNNKGGVPNSTDIKLSFGNMGITLESKSKVILETALHHTGTRKEDHKLLPYEVPIGSPIILFCQKYVLDLCQEIRVYSEYLAILGAGLKRCYDKQKEFAVDIPVEMLRNMRLKIEAISLVSACSLSLDKFASTEELMSHTKTASARCNRLKFIYTSCLDTPENPGAVMIISPDILLALQRELVFITEQPVWESWLKDQRF